MKLSNLHLHIAVNAVVKHDYKTATERFLETDGSAEAFGRLETSMYAVQALANKTLVDRLEKVGVGHWTESLAAELRKIQL